MEYRKTPKIEMNTTPETNEWRKAWAGESQYADPIVDSAVEVMQKLETERNAARREALEYAAQRCRYYIKHQDYPSRWEDKSEYQQGVQIACDNLAEIMLEEAGKYPPNA
jgi:hypothetical protein